MSVFLAIPVNREFPWQTTMSLIETVAELVGRGIKYEIKFIVNGSLVHKVRSTLAHEFLKTGLTHIFWIDSDIAWAPADFMRMLALGTCHDVVGVAYPAKREPCPEFLINVDATKAIKADDHGCLPLKGMGIGFTICRREVLLALAKDAPKIRDDNGELVPMIFRTDILNEQFRGEDIVFFEDCAKIGSPLWVDPGIELGHVGGKEYRGKLQEALQQVKKDGDG